MAELLDILKYTIPLALTLLAVYLLFHRFFRHEALKLESERRRALQKEVFPVRMQAYERIVLLLERISPNQLILRINRPGLNALQFQSLMIQTIRDEYDHNLSQQVYISSRAWELVRTAKEEMIRLINTAAGNIAKEAPAPELAGKLLEMHASLQHDPLSRAIETVKQEARNLL